MLKLVVGSRGKGKTKFMLETANNEAMMSDGLVIYLDKNSKHIFELNKHIRFINVREYPVTDFNSLVGFICGLVAGNSDIEAIYFDSFLTLADLNAESMGDPLDELISLSAALKVDFILSVSLNENEIIEKYKEYMILSL